MAESVYDPDDDEQYSPLKHKSSDKAPYGRSDLRGAEENGAPAGQEVGPPSGSGPSTSSSLRDTEESGLGTSTAGSGGGRKSLYNANGDTGAGLRGRLGQAKAGVGKLAAKAMKKKLLFAGILGGGAGIIAIIVLLLLVLGAYKVVDFAEHVAAYQFARSTAQMAENTTSINDEKIALESIPDTPTGNRLVNVLKTKFNDTALGGKAGDLWSKLDDYRPNKIITNLGTNGTFVFNEGTTNYGTTYIRSVTMNGEEIALRNGSLSQALARKVIPGYSFANNITYSGNVAPKLNDALKANTYGPITRARVASAIRDRLGISLSAWVISKYLPRPGQTGEEAARAADAAEQQMSFDVGEGSNPTAPVGPEDKYTKAAQDLEAVQKADAQDPTKSINPDQLSLDLKNSLENSFPASVFSSFQSVISRLISFINPVYAVAVPACLIYDGSLQKSQPAIDNQTQQAERAGILVQTQAAQEKEGNNVTAAAVGAADRKLGDISATYAEQRAYGLPADTSDFVSMEASPTGQYTYSLTDFVPGPLGTIAQAVGGACPVLTNLWFAGGVGLLSLVAIPEFQGADGTLAGAARAAADVLIPKSAADFGAKLAAAKGSIASFAFKTTRSVALIGGATLIAQRIVASEAGAVHSSLDTGPAYDNTADCGTNIYANEIERIQFYGAPLSDSYLPADNAANRAQLAYQNSQQSTFNRYLSVNNAASLVSRVALASSGSLNGSAIKAPLRLGSALLNPVRSFSTILNPLISRTSFAAAPTTSVNTYCGNVQFGYTPYEKQLIDTDPSYKLLENQLYLDQSGQEDAIASRYGKCFDPDVSIGTLLAEGDIQRDNSGSVVPDKGLCSPKNLGTANADPGQGPAGHGFHDLVFRWRVAQGYRNTLDQLTQMQDVSP